MKIDYKINNSNHKIIFCPDKGLELKTEDFLYDAF